MTASPDRSASAELDRRVAVEVMGYTVDSGVMDYDGSKLPWTVFRRDGETYNPIKFSTDIACAWQVVEAMAARQRSLVLNHTGGEYRCRFLTIEGPRIWDWARDPNDGMTEWNASAPLAICLAALRAAGRVG